MPVADIKAVVTGKDCPHMKEKGALKQNKVSFSEKFRNLFSYAALSREKLIFVNATAWDFFMVWFRCFLASKRFEACVVEVAYHKNRKE